MLANEKMTKLEGKEKSVDFMEKVSSTKFEKIKSETCIRPRFASHTLSSLMKTRTPINIKKSSSLMRSARTSKRSQKGLLYNRPNGIYKRRSIAKQNKNMQALMTILKWEKKDYRASVSLSRQDNELTGTVSECVENSLVFLSNDLIKDISLDLKKCTASPAKLVVPRGESARVVDQSEKHVENSQTLLQGKMGHMDLSSCQNNSENIGDNVKNCTIVDIARQLQSDDEEKNCAKSHEIEVPHCKLGPSEPEEKLEEKKDCTAIKTQVPLQNVSTIVKDYTSEYLMLRKYMLRHGNRKRVNKKTETKHVDIDRAYNVNLQDSQNCKFMKHNNNWRDKDEKSVVNCNVPTIKKGALKKNLVFTNQKVWRPPGVTKSLIIKSTMSSTQPASQKSSRSTERSIAYSMENKYSSVKPVELTTSSESTNTSISINQMKENRDPHANHVTKTCEHLAETKQQQKLLSRGALPKRKRWSTKVDSTTLNNRNDTNPKISKSRQWHTVTPRESSQNLNKQSRIESAVIYNRRSKPLEIITTLKEIINNVKIEDVEENAYNVSNDVFNNKESDSGLQTSNCDASTEMLQPDETNFIKNKHFDKANRFFDQSFWKSISTQTEGDLELTKILKLTQIATQSSPSCSNVETGCNTSHYSAICKDVGVSCDLIDSTNSKVDIDLTAIEDKTLTLENVPVRTEFITHTENEEKIEYSDRDKEFPISERKQTLSTEMTLELEDYDIMETPGKTTNNFTTDEEKVADENFQICLKLSKDSDDKTNIEEFLEDDVEHKDTVMSELKVEEIPSDVIAAFELAKQRAYNLRKAISIYYDNLMPEITDQVIPERTDNIIDENSQSFSELPENSDDKTNIDTHRTFDTDYNYLVENLFTERYPLPSPAIYNYRHRTSEEIAEFLEDIDVSSTCSSDSSNSIQPSSEGDVSPYQLPLRTYCEFMNKKKIKLLSELLMEGIERKEDNFKILSLNKNDNEDFEAAGTIETLALPTSVEEILSIISLKNLSSLIYFILGIIIFWCFQVWFFKCDSAT